MRGERLQIVVPPKVAKEIKKQAKADGKSISGFVADKLVELFPPTRRPKRG